MSAAFIASATLPVVNSKQHILPSRSVYNRLQKHAAMPLTSHRCSINQSNFSSNSTHQKKLTHLCYGTIDPEALTDRTIPISELQKQLQVAIDSEDYTVAAQLRDEIERRRFDNRFAIEEANDAFYQAFQSGSLKAMSDIWGTGEHIQCVHPGSGCIAGRNSVLESWKLVLGTGRMSIGVQDVRIFATESEGFVTCVEVLDAGDSKGKVVATNIFEKQGGKWKIVHHHGSRLPGLF